MRKRLSLALVVLGAGAALAAPAQAVPLTAAPVTAASAGSSAGPLVAGLTTAGDLVTFRAGRPGAVTRVGRIAGLRGDRKVVGIDYRVQDGKLYAVGDKGGIYTLGRGARAVKVSQLSVALEGASFGVDFNPAANRLRVVSDTGQNLRHNIDDPMGAPPAGRTAVDGPLTNPPVPPATAGARAKGVTAAAYTNNDLSPDTATTLFDLDTAGDQVSLQSPANAGNLAPAGKLGVDAGPVSGFDIHSVRRGGVTVSNTGYATLKVGGAYRFHTVNPLTGTAFRVGTFPAGRQVTDIAVTLG
jgi:hypothetical protein